MTNFRDYSSCNDDVKKCYKLQRQNQNVNYVTNMIDKYCSFNNKETFWNLFDKLHNFKDLSDPDINLPNQHH